MREWGYVIDLGGLVALAFFGIQAAILLVLAISIIRNRIRLARKSNRNWFQIHLLTVVLLSVTSGVMIMLNLQTGTNGVACGFPLACICGNAMYPRCLTVDIVVAAAVHIVVLFTTETVLRHRQYRLPKPPPPPGAWRS